MRVANCGRSCVGHDRGHRPRVEDRDCALRALGTSGGGSLVEQRDEEVSADRDEGAHNDDGSVAPHEKTVWIGQHEG